MSGPTSMLAARNRRAANEMGCAAGVTERRAARQWDQLVDAFAEQQACRAAFALAEERQVRLSITDCGDGLVEGLISTRGRIVFRHREPLTAMGALWRTLAAWLTEAGQLDELRGRL